MPQAKPAPV